MTSEDKDPYIGGLVDRRYEITSRIARGGMATVYLARDRRLDRDVAIKIMHQHLADDVDGAAFVSRFRREARAAARLAHPGVVAVYDQGVDGETSYLTLEYVKGSNLRKEMHDQQTLTLGRTFDVLTEILTALAAAHRAGLVHRDIKPENVLLTEEGHCKVADFGLARAVTEVTSTTTGTILGTMAYLAPEVVSTGTCDARTDVYAMGILAYEMLTGTLPHTGATPIQVAFQHVHHDVPAPRTVVPWLPAGVDALVTTWAARNPDDRPANAKVALDALKGLRDEIEATDPGLLTRRADPPERDADGTDVAGAEVAEAEADSGAAFQKPHTSGLAMIPTGAVHAMSADESMSADPESSTVEESGAAEESSAVSASGPVSDSSAASDSTAVDTEHVVDEPTVVAPTVKAPTMATAEQAPPGADEVRPAPPQASSGKDVTPAKPDTPAKPPTPTTTPASKHPVRRRLLAIGAILVVGLLVALGGWWWSEHGPGAWTIVPGHIVGVTESAARSALDDAHLNTVVGYDYDDHVPQGDVIAAEPTPGTRARVSSDVHLTVSQGIRMVTMPEDTLVGLQQEDAEKLLSDAGVTFQDPTQTASDTVPRGEVTSVSQDPGTQLPHNEAITWEVSSGPAPVTIPQTVGSGGEQASAQLESWGLVPKFTDDEYSSSIPAGQVMHQEPEAGTQGHRTDVVTLTVSKGPPIVDVPDVLGMHRDEAEKVLRDAGFEVTQNCWLGCMMDRVQYQDVTGTAPQGTMVTLTIW
ncbi:MAG: protein kinase [Cellulomonadaceae bacterium]|jgi:serine/threonine-protein kinase|nr:protein kinase [Cellulomonadaceae bacterium]